MFSIEEIHHLSQIHLFRCSFDGNRFNIRYFVDIFVDDTFGIDSGQEIFAKYFGFDGAILEIEGGKNNNKKKSKLLWREGGRVKMQFVS